MTDLPLLIVFGLIVCVTVGLLVVLVGAWLGNQVLGGD